MMANERHDTTIAIWDVIYHCRILKRDLYSDQHIEMFSYITSGDRRLDKDLLNTPHDIWINIDKMLEYFKRGVTVFIPKESDVLKVHDAVERHLEAWANQVGFTISGRLPPVDDLLVMDSFCDEIYSLIKPHYLQRKSTSSFEDYMVRRQKQISLFSRKDPLIKIDEEYVFNNAPVRQSYKSVFLPYAKASNTKRRL